MLWLSVLLLISATAIGVSSRSLRNDLELSQSPDCREALLNCGLDVVFPDLLSGSSFLRRIDVVPTMYCLPPLSQGNLEERVFSSSSKWPLFLKFHCRCGHWFGSIIFSCLRDTKCLLWQSAFSDKKA